MPCRTAIRSTLALVTTLFLSATAQAQLFRAYLATDGSDANPCTLAQPCRLLPAALTAVADGGEIWMLDSANYNTGPVNITKSVTILAVPGALGSVVAAGGNAIDIATAGVKVALRNLVVVPLLGVGGMRGINMTSGAELTVENCLLAHLPGTGVYVNTAANVGITDSTIRGGGSYGLRLEGGARATVTRATISGHSGPGILVNGIGANTTTADITNSSLAANDAGVFAYSGNASGVVKVSVRDSLISRNANYGGVAQSDAGAAVTLSASNNTASNNATGIGAVGAGAKVWASGNTVSDNGIGLSNPSGVFETAGSNALRNNVSNKSGTITVIAME